MTTFWLPFRRPALALLLLHALLKIEPCVMAFTPRFQRTGSRLPAIGRPATILNSRVSGGLPDNKSTNEKKDRKSRSTTERRRKLVDRSNVYNIESGSTSTSSAETLGTTPLLDEEEELCYLDDMPGTTAGETCFVSHSSSLASPSFETDSNNNNNLNNNNESSKKKFLLSLPFNTRDSVVTDVTLKYLPFIMPIIAYSSYESTAKIFERTVEYISNNNWVAVDGGQYQANIITPAVNGIVVPSIALLFATMTSNTINTLRQRQLQIRTSLNTEANDLRMLATMVDSLPPQLSRVKNHLREYLIQYASRVIAESRPGLSVDVQMFIGAMDTEMNGFLGLWNALSMSSYGTMYVDTMLPAANYTLEDGHFQSYQTQLGITCEERRTVAPFLSSPIFSESYDALTRLRHERSVRLSALQSTYPMLHYVILGLLAGSICTVFLMETNQELLIFLSAIQLRILWSMLIGTFSALAVVNYDMRDPFRGSYNVAISVDQFYTIREAIRATIQMEQEYADVNTNQSAVNNTAGSKTKEQK